MPSLLIFLLARMLYTDGLTAIFAFGGIYGASVFGWGPLELGIFGIVLTLVGAFGALIGGGLDDRLGPKTVIVFALLALIAGAIGILSVDKTHILFTTDVAEKIAGSKPFSCHRRTGVLGLCHSRRPRRRAGAGGKPLTAGPLGAG